LIAIDTNLLVYAHREDSPWHAGAFRLIRQLAENGRLWAIPWPCIHEFLAVVTNPRIFLAPTPLRLALAQIAAWLEAPSLVLLCESSGYWEELRSLAEAARIHGGLIHDARVAALCRYHGVTELWTADRDFHRFPQLKVRYPLASP